MCRFLSVLVLVIGFPLSGFAQFVDRGEYVEVSKGVTLCSNADLETLNGCSIQRSVSGVSQAR